MSIHSKTRILIHIVWSTRKRKKLLPRPTRIELNQYLQEYSANHSIQTIISYVNADHVHLLIDLDPTKSLSSQVKLLKGASSRWINKRGVIPRKFSWGRGYGAFSVSQSHAGRVIKYICNQDEHHGGRSSEMSFMRS